MAKGKGNLSFSVHESEIKVFLVSKESSISFHCEHTWASIVKSSHCFEKCLSKELCRNKFESLVEIINNYVDVLLVSGMKSDFSFPTAQICVRLLDTLYDRSNC